MVSSSGKQPVQAMDVSVSSPSVGLTGAAAGTQDFNDGSDAGSLEVGLRAFVLDTNVKSVASGCGLSVTIVELIEGCCHGNGQDFA